MSGVLERIGLTREDVVRLAGKYGKAVALSPAPGRRPFRPGFLFDPEDVTEGRDPSPGAYQCDDELALVRHDYEGTSRWEHEETDMS